MIKAAQQLFSNQGLRPQHFISDMAART